MSSRCSPAARAGESGSTSTTRRSQASSTNPQLVPSARLDGHARPDALELAADVGEGGLELVRRDVGGIRIVERPEHALDGALEELVRLRLADILIVDAPVRLDEGLDGGLLIGVPADALAAQAQAGREERHARERQHQDGSDGDGDAVARSTVPRAGGPNPPRKGRSG